MSNKTKPTEINVADFIASSDPKKIEDTHELVAMMERISGEPATMWGPSIIGFGTYDYQYKSGRTGTMCRIGFSPRKAAFSLYILHCDEDSEEEELLKDLGKYKLGDGACLYVKKLADIDKTVLEQLIYKSLAKTKEEWG